MLDDGTIRNVVIYGGLADWDADAQYTAGELREAGGFRQSGQGVFPVAPVNHIIPFGNEVVKGAAGIHPAQLYAALAEGHAAVHATSALPPPFRLVQHGVKLLKVANALQRLLSGVFHPIVV
jgi:hypothetical protein